MSPNVFIAPCDSPNFDRTVREPVTLSEHPAHPAPLSGVESVRFWGVREGEQNQNYFEKMESGDLVLFYQDGEYVGVGWIGTTFVDEEGWARTTFWDGAPSKFIYTLSDFSSISVPKSRVNVLFDYVADYNPEGLMRVADRRVTHRSEVIKRSLEKYSEKHG